MAMGLAGEASFQGKNPGQLNRDKVNMRNCDGTGYLALNMVISLVQQLWKFSWAAYGPQTDGRPWRRRGEKIKASYVRWYATSSARDPGPLESNVAAAPWPFSLRRRHRARLLVERWIPTEDRPHHTSSRQLILRNWPCSGAGQTGPEDNTEKGFEIQV